MPLQKQVIPVPLSLGLDQKTDVRGLTAQGAVQMTNLVRLKNGAVRKRFGYTALVQTIANGTSIAAATTGGSYLGAPWLSDGKQIYVYSDQQAAWVKQGKGLHMPEAGILDRIPIQGDANNLVDFDIAYGSGFLVAVWITDLSGLTTVSYSVIDVSGSSYANVQGPIAQGVIGPTATAGSAFGTMRAPKIIVCGTTAVLVYNAGAGTVLYAQKMDLTNPNGAFWTNETLLATPAGAAVQGIYDVAPVNGDATRFALMYETGGGTSIQLNIFTVSTLASATTKNFEATASFATHKSMALVATNAGHYWLAWTATTGAGIVAGAPATRGAFYNEGGASQSAVVPLFTWSPGTAIGKMGLDSTEALGAFLVASTGEIAGTTAMGTSKLNTLKLTDVAGAVNIVTGSNFFNMQAGSRPWINTTTSEVYFDAYLPSTLQGTHFVCAFGTGNAAPIFPLITAVFAPRLTKKIAQPFASSLVLPHSVALSGLAGSVQAIPISVSSQTFHSSLYVELLDFATKRGPIGAELGGTLALTSSCPSFHTGSQPCENSFICYPELPAPVAAGAGGSLSAGTYKYIVTYEMYGEHGEIHRSATSPAASVVTVANDKVTLTIPGYQASNRTSTNVSAVVYRTIVNGTLYYRQTADPPPVANNVAGSQTIAIVDTMSDATLTASATAQLLYTTGGVLDNFTPGGARCVMVADNRIWLAGCDEPTQVWPSKALTTGEMPGFNEVMNFNCTGAVRAMAAMDDKKVFFVQRGGLSYGIEYVTGQGPTDTGTQSDWTPPQQIPSDVGAIDQRGVCTGPFGVLFRSPVGGPNGSGGIFQLSRDLQVKYLSSHVEDLLAANPVVTSMVLHPTDGRVYIECVPTETGFTSGVCLVWDYLNGGTWSSFQRFDADTSQTSAGARCGFVANTAANGPAYHWATATGRVYRETNGVGPGAYKDAGTWITSTYQSAWLKPELGGFARFWGVQLQGDSLESHAMTVTLTFDEAPSSYYSESHTWTAVQMAAFDRAPLVAVSMIPGNQKAESIQVTLSDAPDISITTPDAYLGAALLAWYRADLGVTLNGSTVSAWADQSHSGDVNKNATQAVGASQPTFNASNANYNGQPTITFLNGVLMATGTWNTSLGQPFTIFFVGNSTVYAFDCYALDGLAGGQMSLIRRQSTNSIIAVAGATIDSGVTTVNTPSIITAVYNGASSSLAVRQTAPQVTGSAGTNGVAGLTIGNFAADGGFAFQGPIAEIIIANGVLSAVQISAITGYLAKRYGLATPGAQPSLGQGPSWAALALEIGIKEGAYRNLPPGQRA